MEKIIVLTGSTRPGRFNMQPAKWIYSIAQGFKKVNVELVDIADFNLPLLDEPAPPMMGNYQNEHTKKFASIISQADGFIVVTPEYNHSTSAALKNAFDYLYAEWNYKPIAFLSYGAAVGGSRAVEHLRGISAQLRMYDLVEQISIINYWQGLNDKGEYSFDEHQIHAAEQLINAVAFWAKEMKRSRALLNSSRQA